MSLRDYAHWNEEAPRIWWEEEGRHADEPSEPDEFDAANDRDMDDPADDCSCWYGSHVKHGGGTAFDIVKFDPECPEHGDEADDD